jgi:hypothetical protein
VPSVLDAVRTCVASGAPGITVHPRADARHITFTDVRDIAAELKPLRGQIEYNIEGWGIGILEAMASGCVVILPEVFRSTFGDGAQYCEPGQVRPLIDELYADFDAFRRLSRRGQDFVAEHFSYEWFQRFLKTRVLAPNHLDRPLPELPAQRDRVSVPVE